MQAVLLNGTASPEDLTSAPCTETERRLATRVESVIRNENGDVVTKETRG